MGCRGVKMQAYRCGERVAPSTGSILGNCSPGGYDIIKFCKIAVRNKNKLGRAIVSPKHLLFPENIQIS